jgi:predicted component of type VI protein secretion system
LYSTKEASMGRSGDELRVGRYVLEVKIDGLPVNGNPQPQTRELAMALMAHSLGEEGLSATPRVRAQSGPGAGATLELTEVDHAFVVGRGQGADLLLADPDASRRHVELIRRGARVMIRDLGSKNGTLLGERELPAGIETPWLPGALLRVANTVLELDDPVADALRANEHAADEPLEAEEPAPEPTPDSGAEAEPAGPSVSAKAARVAAAGPDRALVDDGVTARNLRTAPHKTRSQGTGWNTTDTLVLLAALAVIGLSLLGLAWVMQGR